MSEKLADQIGNLLEEHGHDFWRAALDLLACNLCTCGRPPEEKGAYFVCKRCKTCWSADRELEEPPTGLLTITPVVPVRTAEGEVLLISREDWTARLWELHVRDRPKVRRLLTEYIKQEMVGAEN